MKVKHEHFLHLQHRRVKAGTGHEEDKSIIH